MKQSKIGGMSDNRRMNISDEAVEAAARAIEEATATWLYPLSGEGADAVARAALEAATQLVTAPAWDDGYGHGYKHGYADCMKLHDYELGRPAQGAGNE